MKKSIFLLATISFLFAYTHAQQLNLKDITTRKYVPKSITPITSSADGEYYFRADANNKMIVKYAYKTGLPTDTIFDVRKARDCTFDSFQGFVMSPDEKRLLVFNDYESIYRHSYKANYYYYDIRRNMLRKLTTNKGKQSVPTFSHDGRMLAYVLDNNIWLAKFDYDTESQVTKDGAIGKIINGATDWVYEEEFATTSLIDFSADGRLLAFVRFDETNVPQFSFQVFANKLYPDLFSFKYPKTGEQNAKVSCNVFDVDAKTIRTMNIPNNMEYIPRIAFLPTGDQLAVMTLNREQNEFNMYSANARSSVSKLILQDKNERYIDSEFLNSIRFFNEQFTYISEKSGYSHIYLYNSAGVLQKQVTSGNYDVTNLLAIDAITKTIFYQVAEESPLQRSIYKIDITKGLKTKLSPKLGYNEALFSENGKYFILNHSSASTLPSARVCNAAGKELRVLEDNASLQKVLDKVKLPLKEFIKIKVQDGTELNAYLMKPTNFDASKKYPLLMVQYSGPNSQEVVDRFGIDWTDYLTTQGFIVACVDGRGTGARGEDFRKCTYLNLGIKESDDQIAAAHYLGSFPYIDKEKMAIWGWSYGGYNVLMSMSRGNGIFKAGIAIAPVTDWRFYDTVYGERFMRTPQQNEAGYNAGSPIQLASKLEGNLLLIHGSADDNVHFQNTMEYADALIKADKQFEMFVFTDKDHSIRGASNRAYLYEKVIRFLKTSM